MLRTALLKASDSALLRREVTGRAATRAIAMRFIAGEHLDDGLAVARTLAHAGKAATLDYLGEDVTRPDDARAAAVVVIASLERIGEENLPAGVSVKPTQMGLRVDRRLCRTLLGDIAAAAEQVGAHVTLDMEGSDVTEPTVSLVEALHADGHRHVGCALQAYLRRTRADVERLTRLGASLRLCKGAYAEPPELAYQSRGEVDAAFAELADWLLEHGVHPRLATHDHRLIARAQNTAVRLGVPRDAFELQMLYGVRTSLQDALVRDRWTLRVYVPFGQRWYPYFMRRLAERPANVAFFLRSLRDT